MYRLMFSDLDETLLVNHHVPKMNQEAILKAREQGLKFVPCTGRAFNMIPDILKEIGTYDKAGEYSLCFNGGLIVENKDNKVLHFKGLDFKQAKDEKIAKILYEKRDMDYLKQLAKKLPESIQETCSIAFSSGRYLEMNTKGVDKGYGMRWLVNYLGYDMDETIGIGDNYNDVEMIKTAKLGCAVACASDDIKELAQYVTQKDYDEGAVKEVIEKFVLGENHE